MTTEPTELGQRPDAEDPDGALGRRRDADEDAWERLSVRDASDFDVEWDERN